MAYLYNALDNIDAICKTQQMHSKHGFKILIGIIQIPLTILYFVISLTGGILSGAGWIAGVIVFMITGTCWIFGQFDVWYQPLIEVGIAGILAFGPVVATDVGSSLVLKIKGLLHTIG